MTSPQTLRPTATATQLSLTRLAGGLTAAGLLWLATWIVLAPPENVPGPWARFGLLSVGLAVPAAAGALRPTLPGARWIPLVASSIAFGALSVANLTTGLIGWWPTMELAALLALAATVALPARAAAVAQLAVLLLAAAVMQRGTATLTMATGPASMVSAGARLLVAAGTVLIGNALLRRAAHATDKLLVVESHQREVLEVEERRRRSDRAARRFLHDSGMNSLEAVSRGVPAHSVSAMRSRCAVDAERWLRTAAAPADDAEAAFEPALQEAAVRGLLVEAHFAVEGRLPTEQLEAMAQAAGEALRNCAKHAETGMATLSVTVGQGSATVQVSDAGRGFDPASTTDGLGLSNSIHRRMLDVGGEAVIDSAPGDGTRVQLRWPVASDSASGQRGATVAAALDLPAMLARLAWLPIAAVAVGAVASAIINRWSVHLAWLLAGSGLMLAAACGWFVHRWRSQALDRFDVALLTSATVVATMLLPVADPFCSAASGPAVIPDGRLVALALVGVLLASWRATLIMLAALLCALAVAALMWQSLWPSCARETIPTAIGLTLVAMIALTFGRAVRTQDAAARAAFATMAATNLELARRRADDLVRAEWGISAVADVRDLLRTISDPASDLDDPRLRRTAGDAAARLRAAVRASELPAALATMAAKLTELGRTYNFRVTVEGDFADTDDGHTNLGTVETTDAAQLDTAAQHLNTWLDQTCPSATSAIMTLSELGGVRSVLLHLASVPPPSVATDPDDVADAAGKPPPAHVTIASWYDREGAWWQAEWSVQPQLIMS